MRQNMPSINIVEDNEQGFVLVTALLIMLVLTIIGIAGSRNTSTELLIAGNDRTYKETFFNADGGTEAGQPILEQNIACDGFPAKNDFATGYEGLNGGGMVEDTFYIQALDFWKNLRPTTSPSDANRDIFYPWDAYGSNKPHTNLKLGHVMQLNVGAAIQDPSGGGYEGLAYGLASGGASLVYDIISQHLGKNNSESIIHIYYRHVVAMPRGDCYY